MRFDPILSARFGADGVEIENDAGPTIAIHDAPFTLAPRGAKRHGGRLVFMS